MPYIVDDNLPGTILSEAEGKLICVRGMVEQMIARSRKFLNIIWSSVVILTHWGQGMHICVGKLTITVSDNGLVPTRRQAVIWTSAEILLNGP